MNNKWFLHKDHLHKDLENPRIFPKSKKDSKNYNIKAKPHKNTKPLTFAKECSTFFTKVRPLYRKRPQGSLHEFSFENRPKMNKETIKALVAQS